MRIVRFAFLSALLLPCLAAAASGAGAQTGGPTASGSYQFSLGDRYTKYVEFSAQTLSDGSTSGSMFFSDQAGLVYQDVDGAGDPEEKYDGFYIKADFDGLVVDGNRAVMSGTVGDSSIRYLIGLRLLLTVEDNGDNTKIPDRLTWGVYKQIKRDWTPSDAELKEDPGVGLRWWATDYEVRDDKGYQMPRDESINTQTFPVATYDFVATDDDVDDIRVQP
jgi:hypothetical protein